jgi:hypothetical protein
VKLGDREVHSLIEDRALATYVLIGLRETISIDLIYAKLGLPPKNLNHHSVAHRKFPPCASYSVEDVFDVLFRRG